MKKHSKLLLAILSILILLGLAHVYSLLSQTDLGKSSVRLEVRFPKVQTRAHQVKTTVQNSSGSDSSGKMKRYHFHIENLDLIKMRQFAESISKEYQSENEFGLVYKKDPSGDSRVPFLFQFNQTYLGYEVYGANLKLFANPENSIVFMSTSSLKKIDKADLRLTYQIGDLKNLLFDRLPAAANRELLPLKDQPVLYQNPSTQQYELVWQVEVSTGDADEAQQLFVSAATGDTLASFPTRSH